MSDCEEEQQCYEGGFPQEDGIIRYGDYVQLRHLQTGRFINTNEGQYEGGSGQQHVYASESTETTWVVLPACGSDEKRGYEVGWDDEVLFKPYDFPDHRLHSSPGVESPSSAQQEVSCFAECDENDNWKVARASDDSCDDFWRVGEQFYLVHVNSGSSLHTHEIEYLGENEVTSFGEMDENSIFVV